MSGLPSRGHRAREERALLNPAFCASLLWQAAAGYSERAEDGMPFEETFLVLPLVLHRGTREKLPRSTRTSLGVWLSENPTLRSRIGERSRSMVPFTREALIFGGMHGFITLNAGGLHAEPTWASAFRRVLGGLSEEVEDCSGRARMVGRWFAQTGGRLTILALLGVRP